jgi:hypothetical protein
MSADRLVRERVSECEGDDCDITKQSEAERNEGNVYGEYQPRDDGPDSDNHGYGDRNCFPC